MVDLVLLEVSVSRPLSKSILVKLAYSFPNLVSLEKLMRVLP